LPTIKVNNDNIEVITTVSKTETDLSTKLNELSDKFERAFSNQHSHVAKMIARLEKVEGESSGFNFPNDSIPQLDSQGVLQTSLSAASRTSLRHLCMACQLVFIRDNHHCRSRPLSDRPHGWFDRPIWPMMGVPGNPPLVNRVDLSATRQSQLAAMYEFNKFKEEVASMVKVKFGINMGNYILYQKPYKAELDLMAYPPGWRVSDFIKFSGEDNRTTWEHISQYIAQLGEASTHDFLKVHSFSLSLIGTAFAWFSSLAPNSVDFWNQLEQKFHDHFFSGDYQLKLTDLTLVKVKTRRSLNTLSILKRLKTVVSICQFLIPA
jgi:hypothetical protein